jgi:hypothetical protein
MFSLIFLIVFPFALWKAWKNVEMAKASTAWPTVSGTGHKSRGGESDVSKTAARDLFPIRSTAHPSFRNGSRSPVDIHREKQTPS